MSDPYRRLDRLAALNARLAAGEPTMLVALGDSNTCNTKFSAGAKQWPELLHERLKDHHRHQRVLLLNSGVSGDCVERVLQLSLAQPRLDLRAEYPPPVERAANQ